MAVLSWEGSKSLAAMLAGGWAGGRQLQEGEGSISGSGGTGRWGALSVSLGATPALLLSADSCDPNEALHVLAIGAAAERRVVSAPERAPEPLCRPWQATATWQVTAVKAASADQGCER